MSTLNTVVNASNPMLVELQNERRLTVVYLAGPNQHERNAMVAQRSKTDKTVATMISRTESASVKRAADDALENRMAEAVKLLRRLGDYRQAVDSGAMGRGQAFQSYTAINETVYRVYDSMATLDDDDFADVVRAAIAVARSGELLTREDALVAGMLQSGRLSSDDLQAVDQSIAIRRYAFDQAMVGLRDTEHRQYQEMTSSPQLAAIKAMEDRLLQTRPGQLPRVTAAQWRQATQAGLADMNQSINEAGERTVDRATPLGVGVVVRLLLAGGLGLLAVIASIIVSITTVRALVRQLERLRDAAAELAEQRLPGVVERLGRGEKVNVAAEAPELQFGDDEIGQVGKAFNQVQQTALATAVEQAELRRGIRDVLLSLARRTQTLVHRQLTMLDTMERRRDIEVKELEELFRLDHLATRMRRNAENLIVLSGALPARGWRNAVPMVDVVRAAVGEVEDYTRVTVLPFGPVELAGRAVGDVTHLLAELIENAVSFSPPDTVVQIGGHLVANGFAIDIEDRGLGMTEDKLAEINERIVDPPEFNLRSSVQLGLFVVAKLAERYGVRVSLKRSAYGGTTAVVVIPQELIVESGTEKAPATATTTTTTENGLAVRQPAPVASGTGGQSTETQAETRGVATLSRQQPAPPALVAVPPPPSVPDDVSEPDGPDTHDSASSTGGFAAADPPGESGPPAVSGVASAADPEISHPEDEPAVSESSTTPSGLPVRVPQANLAAPLQTDEPVVAEPDEPDDPGRSPEEIQRIMGSYQRGTRLARTAVEARGNEAPEGEDDQ
ncbi:nitrate- and nitrite sensing domain-containing protein [Spirillospora sp. CA-142024]|uniref:sensor histidine kinase n=1 Tax=Spirillospora sp. CA-142024 TaxID=3240036 RepID=UPI003D921220